MPENVVFKGRVRSDAVIARPADPRLFGFFAILLGFLAILAPVISGMSIALLVGVLKEPGYISYLHCQRGWVNRFREASFALGQGTSRRDDKRKFTGMVYYPVCT